MLVEERRTPEADHRVLLDGERDHVLAVLGLGRHVPADAGGLGEGRAQRCAATLLILQAKAVEVGRRHLGAHGGGLGTGRLGVNDGHDLLLQGLVASEDDLRLHLHGGGTADGRHAMNERAAQIERGV